MGDFEAPGYNGMGFLALALNAVSLADWKRKLFSITFFVRAGKFATVGAGQIETKPFIKRPILLPSGPGLKSLPPLGPEPKPFALATYIVFPSGLVANLEGNHPTGICPFTTKFSAEITATALMPDSATYNVLRSGDSVSPNGITPLKFFNLLSGLSRIFLTSLWVRASNTETQSLVPLLTKTYFSVAAIELGLAPPTAGIPSINSPI